MKFLDFNGLTKLTQIIKEKIPTKTSQLTNDSNFVTKSEIPQGVTMKVTGTTLTITLK